MYDIPLVSRDLQDRSRFRRFRFRLWMIPVLGILAVGLLLGVRAGYQHFRERSIDRNLERARAAAKAGQWDEAENLAKSVLMLRNDFDGFRIWSRALAAKKEPRAYVAAIRLFSAKQATQTDRAEAFAVICQNAPHALVGSAWAKLPLKAREQSEFRAPMATFLLSRGSLKLAENLLREDPNLKTSPIAQVALVKVLCAVPEPDRVEEARAILSKLIAENLPEGLEALEIIGRVPGGLAPSELLVALQPWVESRPDAKAIHHLYGMQAEILAKPAQAEAIYQKAVDRFINDDPAVLGSWLIAQGRSAQVVSLLQSAAKNDGEAYLTRLRALQREKMTAELDQALASPPEKVNEVDLSLIRAAVALDRKDAAKEKAAWDGALAAAAKDRSGNRFLEITRYAGLMRARAVEENALVAAAKAGWGPIPLYPDFGPVLGRLAQQNRTLDMLAVYKTLRRYEPENSEVQNNYFYLSLLHNTMPPEEAARALEELHKKYPDQLSIQSSLAFAQLLNHQPELALISIRRIEEGPMKQAIKGTALWAAGNRNEGEPLLQTMDWSKLLLQESISLRRCLIEAAAGEKLLPNIDELTKKVKESAPAR